MPPIALIIFDAVVALEKTTPGLIKAFSELHQLGDPSDEQIAAKRAELAEGLDTSDPLRPGL